MDTHTHTHTHTHNTYAHINRGREAYTEGDIYTHIYTEGETNIDRGTHTHTHTHTQRE